jgi:replicative DNA helicase
VYRIGERMTELNNEAAEKAVLAGLCQYGVEFFYEIDYVEPQAFYNLNNQRLFKCLERSFKDSEEIDLSSILSSATELGFHEEIANDEEIGFVRSLFTLPIARKNAEIQASKLTKLLFANRASVLSDRIKHSLQELTGNEPITDIIGLLETPVLEFTAQLYKESDNKPVRPADTIDEYLAEKESNPVDMIGISTGWKNFDKAIGGGLRRKCVDLIGARMKMGKSFSADGLCMNIASRDIPVLIVDTEMSRQDHDDRMISYFSGVSMDQIATGKYIKSQEETRKVRAGTDKFKGMNYKYVNVSGIKFSTILGIMRNFIYRDVGFDESGVVNDCVIIYDYFKVTDSSEINDSMKEHQLLAFQMMDLHNFAVKNDVPIVSFIQLNRDGITKESTDVVAGSDGILKTCTSFSILKEKSEEELANSGGEDRGNRKLVPIVARHGGGLDGSDYINFNYDFEFANVKELETRNYYLKNEEGFSNDDSTGTDIENC